MYNIICIKKELLFDSRKLESIAEFYVFYVYGPDSSPDSLFQQCIFSIPYVWQRKKVLQGEAVSLLRSDNTVFDKALVLCQMHNFKEGVLYLYEKGKL